MVYGAHDYADQNAQNTYGDERSQSRSRSRSRKSANDPSTLKKRYRQSDPRIQGGMQESEYDDQYTDPRLKHQGLAHGSEGDDGEGEGEDYDDEGEDMGEGEDEDESLM